MVSEIYFIYLFMKRQFRKVVKSQLRTSWWSRNSTINLTSCSILCFGIQSDILFVFWHFRAPEWTTFSCSFQDRHELACMGNVWSQGSQEAFVRCWFERDGTSCGSSSRRWGLVRVKQLGAYNDQRWHDCCTSGIVEVLWLVFCLQRMFASMS